MDTALLIGNIVLAITAILLAIAAFCSIFQTARALAEDRNNRQIEKSPIFHIEEQDLKMCWFGNKSCVHELEVEIKNIGFGPAFNVSLECSQGTSKFSVWPTIDGKMTDEGMLTEGAVPLHLVIEAKGKWTCGLGNNVKKGNAVEPLVLTVSGESMFRNRVKQQFVWISNKWLGRIPQDALPRLSKPIDFGIPDAKGIKWLKLGRRIAMCLCKYLRRIWK